MRTLLKNALKKKYEGVIAECEANIEIYMRNPTGIGEHPDIVLAVDQQLTLMAEAQDKLSLIENWSD